METKDIVVSILEKQEREVKQRAAISEWGLTQTRRLSSIIEADGGTVSSALWDLFLFNITGLRINPQGKVVYLSFCKRPSKRILTELARHNSAIVKNFNYITRV